MQLQYRSIDSLLSDIEDDFDLSNTDWFSKSIGWIARGLEIMAFHDDIKVMNKTLTIESGKALLPCDVQTLMFFTQDCRYYRIKSDFKCQCQTECPTTYTNSGNYVEVNERYVFAPFDSGELICHYYGIPTDDCGYPLIVDDPFVTEALAWFVTYKMLTNGYKHHTIKDWREAKAMWEQAYPRAQNSVNFIRPDQAQTFMNNWLRIAKDPVIIQHYFTK